MAEKNLLIIFAKAPLPGQVKTRLAKTIGPTKAAAVYKEILGFIVNSAYQAQVGAGPARPQNSSAEPAVPPTNPYDIKLYLASSQTTSEKAQAEFDNAFQSSGERAWPELPIILQTGDDLGQRMGQALWNESLYYTRIILIGTDFPYLTGSVIGRLFHQEVDRAPLSFGPTIDGGYYLVALCPRRLAAVIPWPQVQTHKPQAKPSDSIGHLFSGINWSTEEVLAQQMDNLKAVGIDYNLLPPGGDIDHLEDLTAFVTGRGEPRGLVDRFPLPRQEGEDISRLRARLKRLM